MAGMVSGFLAVNAVNAGLLLGIAEDWSYRETSEGTRRRDYNQEGQLGSLGHLYTGFVASESGTPVASPVARWMRASTGARPCRCTRY